jgi:hypothetical protein
MTEPGDDFETFLKTRTLLPHGMSDDDKLEPPKALDTIVLKKAREAIHAREQPNRAPRWATPVALAATILLCLSIVLNVSLNTNRPTANLQRMAATTSSATPAAAPMPASPMSEGERRDKVADSRPYNEAILPEAKVAEPRAPRPPVVAEEATPAPAPRESLRRGNAAADKADALANGSGRRVPALRAAPSNPDSAADKAAALLADRSGTPTQAPSEAKPAVASAADQAAQLADSTASPTQAQSETQSAARAAPDSVTTLATRGYAGTTATAARAAATRESAAAGSMASSGASRAAPPAAATGPAGPPPAVVARAAAPSSPANEARPSPPTAAPAATAAPPRARAADTEDRDQPALAKPKPAAAPTHPKDPETWLQQIADLRAEGKTAQADAEMQHFRATFPAYKPRPDTPSEPRK